MGKDVCRWSEELGLHWFAAGYWGWQEKMLWAEAVEWVNVHLEYLKAHHFEFTQERLDRRFYIGGYKLSYVREESSADWFQLKAEIMLDNGYKFYLQDLWENILSGIREYKLKNGLVFMIRKNGLRDIPVCSFSDTGIVKGK